MEGGLAGHIEEVHPSDYLSVDPVRLVRQNKPQHNPDTEQGDVDICNTTLPSLSIQSKCPDFGVDF